MEACEVVLRLLSEMRRKGGNGARIACFQLGKRLQITLRGRIIKLFSPYWFKGTQGLRSPSEQQITNRPSMEILHRLCQRSTDTDASTKLLVGSFEPRANISCIAIGGVIEEADTTEIPHYRGSGMDANPGDTKHDTLFVAAFAERLGIVVQCKCARDRPVGMVGLFTWCSKQHVQGIADDLGDGAIMGKHDIGHACEVLIEQWPEHAGLQRLDEGGETSDVGEKRRDFSALSAKIDGISIPGKTLGEVWREIPRQ